MRGYYLRLRMQGAVNKLGAMTAAKYHARSKERHLAFLGRTGQPSWS
jgi:hypothetical protein